MKVLHALHGYPPEHKGGTELYVQRVAELQRADGHDVVIAAGSFADRYDGFEATTGSRSGIRVFRISQRGLFSERWDHSSSPYVEESFGRLLETERPDLVHVHHWIRLTRTLVRRAHSVGIPCVITLNDLYASCPRIFRVREGEPFCMDPLSVSACTNCVPREPWMSDEVVGLKIRHFARDMSEELASARALIAPSEAHARVLAKFTNLPEERFDVLPPGYEATKRQAKEASWTPDSGRPLRIAHWGNLVDYKGVHILLQALCSLERKDEIELVLWGNAEDKSYGQKLRSLWRELTIERKRGFSPKDLAGLRADLAVFPSLAHESHSFVLDEAFALGLPVLVSDRGALPERCGGGGLVFSAGSVEGLARLIERLLDDPDELARMRAELPRSLDFDEHWQRLEKIYSRALRESQAESLEEAAIPNLDVKHTSEAQVFEQLAVQLEDRSRALDGLADAAETEVKSLRKDVAELFSKLEDRESRLAEQDKHIRHHTGLEKQLEAALEAHRADVAQLREAYQSVEGQLRISMGKNEIFHAWVHEKNQELAQRVQEIADRDGRLAELKQSLVQEIADSDGRLVELKHSVAEQQTLLQELRKHVANLERLVWKRGRENRLALPLVIPAKIVLRAWDWLTGSKQQGTGADEDRSDAQ